MNLALFAWVASGYRYKAVAHKRRAPKKVKQALPPRVGRAGSGGPAGAPQWARPQPMRIPSGPVRPCCRPCLACACRGRRCRALFSRHATSKHAKFGVQSLKSPVSHG